MACYFIFFFKVQSQKVYENAEYKQISQKKICSITMELRSTFHFLKKYKTKAAAEFWRIKKK